MKKLSLAIGLGSTCSGCDIAILDLAEKVLDLLELVDIVYWPTAMDFKLSDLEAKEADGIDLCLYHGTIRTSQHALIARLLREKAKLMLAFGSCACFGGIPGLCNLTCREELLRIVYRESISTLNPAGETPRTVTTVNGFELSLPELSDSARALCQEVDVDGIVPGCPPAVELIEKLIPVLREMQAGNLPPKGAVIASEKSVCDECPLEKEDKGIEAIVRVHEKIPDPGRCLLEQGILCMGPATRGGCGAACIQALMPCRGCMGPLAEVKDQGARMISAVASILSVNEEKDLTEQQIEALINSIRDPAGSFYRFTLPVAFLNRRVARRDEEDHH